jgi:hypothetical protein
MKLRSIAISLALAATVPAGASAQTPAGPPKPDLSPMAFFVGSWSCSVTDSPNPKRVGMLSKAGVVLDPGGFWLQQTTEHGTSFITWDAKKKLWAFIGVGAAGYGVGTSPGWTGDTLVVSDAYNSGDEPLGSTTFKRVGDTAFNVTYTVPGPAPLSETQACTKPAS